MNRAKRLRPRGHAEVPHPGHVIPAPPVPQEGQHVLQDRAPGGLARRGAGRSSSAKAKAASKLSVATR
eukprot:9883741-Alexandrium_andersonii.AAC.1